MIKAILWDIDATLLDFLAAEKAALTSLFRTFEIGELTEEMLARYMKINRAYWEQLERGEIEKERVLVGRFEDFFEQEGIDPGIAAAFNASYQSALGDTIVFRDDSYELIKQLRGKVKQYVVSNGTAVAQEKKLRLSGLGDLMDGIFISEEVGYEKPDLRFFEAVFDGIEPFEKDEMIIIGDSLTSDMRGGLNAGIKTCWYNPGQQPLPDGMVLDHVIGNLKEVPGIL